MVAFAEGRDTSIIPWFLTTELKSCYGKLPDGPSRRKKNLVGWEAQNYQALLLWNESSEFRPF